MTNITADFFTTLSPIAHTVSLPSTIEDVMEIHPEMTYEQAEEEFDRLYDDYFESMNRFERG